MNADPQHAAWAQTGNGLPAAEHLPENRLTRAKDF
jgi:hypothetical protein